MPVGVDELEAAVQCLIGGGVVAFPTETVYGVGALATLERSVERLFTMKGRPRTRPLILHLHRAAAMETFAATIPDYAFQLAEAFWPGPLTLVLPRREIVLDVVTGGGDTVAMRVPDHPLALQLIATVIEREGPRAAIAAPSANPFGEPPAMTAQEVVAKLGKPGSGPNAPDVLLDGGACRTKVPSAIVSCVGAWPRILRRGAISVQEIEDVLGRWVDQ